MRTIRAWWSRLAGFVSPDRGEREFAEELQSHLGLHIDDNLRAGMTPAEARRRALAKLGSVASVSEAHRARRGLPALESVHHDIRYALRGLGRNRSFAVAAILTLALGIGATAAVFSVLRAVLLEPLPYPRPERVVAIWETNRGGTTRNGIATANFVVWRERSRVLADMGMVGPRGLAIMLNGQPIEVTGLSASSAVYRALDVQAALGRVYTADEDARNDVIVLSHDFWQRAFNGRADVLGMALTTDGEARVVIGVMPPRFSIAGQPADFLVPYGQTDEQLRSTRGRGGSYALARLRDEASLDAAYTEMRGIYAALENEEPQRNAGRTVMLFRLTDQMVGEVRPALLTLMAAVALMLLVACVNVANLLLARSAARAREFAMRTALGAGRGRLVRQLLIESLMLAAAGGVAGLGVAMALHQGLLTLAGRVAIPRIDQAALDLPVVLFTMGVAMATGVVFGLAPALMSANASAIALREGGRTIGGGRLHRALDALVVVEVALSLVLLVGAGLLLKSFLNQRSIEVGYRTDHVLTARVSLPSRYERASAQTLFDEALTRLSALPGIQGAAAAVCLPSAGCAGTTVWRLDQEPPPDAQRKSSQIRVVSPAYFRTMAIAQLAGRDFAASDTAASVPVAIVSESMARDYFGADGPLETELHINTIAHANGSSEMPWRIVGVVRDVRSSVDGAASRVVYVPLTQMPGSSVTFLLRTDVEPMGLAPAVTRTVHALEPESPVRVRALDEVVAGTIARPRAIAVLLAAFALLTLALASIGVYGVMAYSVRERTQEIGVRLALGATAAGVCGMVMGRALRLAALGAVGGVAMAIALSPLVASQLFGVGGSDPATIATVVAALLTVALLAAAIPAARVLRVDPVTTLRCD